MGDIANIAYAYERKSCFLSNITIYFVLMTLLLILSRLNPVKNAFWAICKVPKYEKESGSKTSGQTKFRYCPRVS